MDKVIDMQETVCFLEQNIERLESSVREKGIQIEQVNVRRPIFKIDIESNDAIKHLCNSVEAYKQSLMVLLKRFAKNKEIRFNRWLEELKNQEDAFAEEEGVTYNDHYKEMILKYDDEKINTEDVEKMDVEDENNKETDVEMDAQPQQYVVDSSEFVASKMVDGKVLMRSVLSWGAHPFYEQVPDTTPVLMIKGKCSICHTHLGYTTMREFHREYAHKGGKHWAKCGFVAFTADRFDDHDCRAPLRRLEIGVDKKVKIGFGLALFVTFALPLKKGNENELWIGTTTSSGFVGAETAVSLVDQAAKVAFRRGKGYPPFCPSLAEKLYPITGDKWTALKDQALCFDGILRGNSSGTEQIKFFLRTVLDTPSHNKPTGIIAVMENVADMLFGILIKEQKIPTKQKLFLKEHLDQFKKFGRAEYD